MAAPPPRRYASRAVRGNEWPRYRSFGLFGPGGRDEARAQGAEEHAGGHRRRLRPQDVGTEGHPGQGYGALLVVPATLGADEHQRPLQRRATASGLGQGGAGVMGQTDEGDDPLQRREVGPAALHGRLPGDPPEALEALGRPPALPADD